MSDEVAVSETNASPAPVTVHGVVVGQVSPLKTSKTKSSVRYFDGSFTDGKKTLRMISFEPKLHEQFEEAKKSQSPVALKNCIVKRGRNDELEILVNSKCAMIKSPKKFKVTEEEIAVLKTSQCPVLGTLEEVKDLVEYQEVTITGKVLSRSKAEQVVVKSSGKHVNKQDFTIADSTAAVRGVAWEDHLDVLKENSSYKITCATVKSFNGAKYILVGERSTIEAKDDIGYVVEESVDGGSGDVKVVKAEIIAVISCETYSSCKNCDGKIIQISKVLGRCGKCNTKLKMSKCNSKKVGRIIIEDSDDGTEYKLTVFDEVLNQIANIAKSTEELQGEINGDLSELLLSAPQLIYTFTSKEVVSCVAQV